MIFLKFVCMFLMILYGFGNMGRIVRKQEITSGQMFLMALGAAGYVTLTQLGY